MRISDWSSDVCSSDLLPPFGSNGVDFINEKTAGRGLCGGLEYFAKLLFGLAIGRADDFRNVNQETFCIAFICHGAGEAGLASAGRAVDTNPPGRIDTQDPEPVRAAEGKPNPFPPPHQGVATTPKP